MRWNGLDFRPVVDVQGYMISNDGQVLSLKKKRPFLRRSFVDSGPRGGWLSVKLSENNKCKNYAVHRLVASAWIGPPPTKKHCINHKNGIKIDNRMQNLEWVTHKENMQHAYRVLYPGSHRGQQNGRSKLSNENVLEIRNLRKNGMLLKDVAKIYKVSLSVIARICNKYSWSHL